MSKSFVSYLRVSTARQGDSGLGLEAQREAVLKYLQSVGGSLAIEFQEIETGKGANALSKRPQLKAALDFARKHRVTLIVAKLDRLTRSARLLLELVELSGGADLVFADLPQIPSGPMGKFMLTALAAVAEFEAGMISQRTKAALSAAKARGIRLGRNGVVLATKRKAEALAFALAVQDAVETAQLEGCDTLQSIAERLNETNVPTRSGSPWHPTTVSRVLRRLKATAELGQP